MKIENIHCPNCKSTFDYTHLMMLDFIGESKGPVNRHIAKNCIKRIKKEGVMMQCPKCKKDFQYEGENK